MVSEFMLQQTPVSRVLPVWKAWTERWPTPPALAAEPVGEAVRAWGRLGYPRRAQRLHAAATAIRDDHAGRVPDDVGALRALPGIGEYTAAAIASFAYGRRALVLDTNVRRVLARLESGRAFAPNHLTRAERERAQRWVPETPDAAAAWAAASMELGALVCGAENPRCGECPVSSHCAWLAAGRPDWDGPARRGQSYAGTDRQCRGVLLAGLRESDAGVPTDVLLARWPADPGQARRALDSLLADGLARVEAHGAIRL
ncbi:MAG: A/G-specific adenine glycosylase [Nigerium sp.]|nr:A/G-specific adenine glycosylase [Nigerium sp.]